MQTANPIVNRNHNRNHRQITDQRDGVFLVEVRQHPTPRSSEFPSGTAYVTRFLDGNKTVAFGFGISFGVALASLETHVMYGSDEGTPLLPRTANVDDAAAAFDRAWKRLSDAGLTDAATRKEYVINGL